MTSDQEHLSRYVDTWESAAREVVALLRSLDESDWSRPTDLPGWDVRAVAAHLAHLESELSGAQQTPVEAPELNHASAPTAFYTEAGLAARKSMRPEEIIDELERAVAKRLSDLRADPPTDAKAIPAITPGGIQWNWETLLRNRPFDLWMHEQDIRRAVGRPGGMNTEAAGLTMMMLAMGFPFSVGKRVAPPVGTTVVLDVSGVHPVHLAVEIADNGRAVPMPADPQSPTAALHMDAEAFVLLGGGRRPPEEVQVRVTGDEELGRRVLESMAITP